MSVHDDEGVDAARIADDPADANAARGRSRRRLRSAYDARYAVSPWPRHERTLMRAYFPAYRCDRVAEGQPRLPRGRVAGVHGSSRRRCRSASIRSREPIRSEMSHSITLSCRVCPVLRSRRRLRVGVARLGHNRSIAGTAGTVSGKRLGTYLQDNLFAALGMTSTASRTGRLQADGRPHT